MKRKPLPWRALIVALGTLLTVSALWADERLEGIACRSVHLGFPADESVVFYNEIKVERSAPGTYFCVCGFRGGYFGIQELANGKKLVIFSVWDPGDQNDPDEVEDEQRVLLRHRGEDVRIGRFGNEGTGGQSFYDFDWQIGETYRFLVKAEEEGERIAFSGYFHSGEDDGWKHLVTFSTKLKTRGLNGCYSFVEDFRRNRESTKNERRAQFGNAWVQTKEEGQWQSLTRARFTADSNPVMNIDAGNVGRRYFLATGGDIRNENTPLREYINLPPDFGSEISIP